MHLIDYGHLRDGVLYHGTVSDLDGTLRSTWTYEEGDGKVTRDLAIDGETFAFLWNGIADFDVFRRCAVRGQDLPIDPTSYHVIGAVFDEGGQRGQCMFLVPASEADPDFIRWLQALNVPGRDQRPSSP
jgi:hypothetical protein